MATILSKRLCLAACSIVFVSGPVVFYSVPIIIPTAFPLHSIILPIIPVTILFYYSYTLPLLIMPLILYYMPCILYMPSLPLLIAVPFHFTLPVTVTPPRLPTRCSVTVTTGGLVDTHRYTPHLRFAIPLPPLMHVVSTQHLHFAPVHLPLIDTLPLPVFIDCLIPALHHTVHCYIYHDTTLPLFTFVRYITIAVTHLHIFFHYLYIYISTCSATPTCYTFDTVHCLSTFTEHIVVGSHVTIPALPVVPTCCVDYLPLPFPYTVLPLLRLQLRATFRFAFVWIAALPRTLPAHTTYLPLPPQLFLVCNFLRTTVHTPATRAACDFTDAVTFISATFLCVTAAWIHRCVTTCVPVHAPFRYLPPTLPGLLR